MCRVIKKLQYQTRITIQNALQFIFSKKLENKVFCLFGTEIDNEKVLSAIELAKKEYKENSDLEIEIAWTKEKSFTTIQFNQSHKAKRIIIFA